MTSANPDPYVEFVEKVIDALEDLILDERHPNVVRNFEEDLDATLQNILNYRPRWEGDR